MDSYVIAAIVVAGLFLLITFTIALVALMKCQTHSHEDETVIRTVEPYGVISSNSNMFVFRPGFQGNQIGVYTDFEKLMDAMDQVAGPRLLFFDDSDAQGEPLRIKPRSNAAVYDMKLVKWGAAKGSQTIDMNKRLKGVDLIIEDTVQINELAHIEGPLDVTYNGALPLMKFHPTTRFANNMPPAFFLENGASLRCVGAGCFGEVDGSNFNPPLSVEVHMGASTTLRAAAAPVFHAIVTGDGLTVGYPNENWYTNTYQIRVLCEGNNWALQENCLGGDQNSSILVDYLTLSGNPQYHGQTYNLPAMDKTHWPNITSDRFHIGLYFRNSSRHGRTFIAARNLQGVDINPSEGSANTIGDGPAQPHEVWPYTPPFYYPSNVWQIPFQGPPQPSHDRSKGFIEGDMWLWFDAATTTSEIDIPPFPPNATHREAELYMLFRANHEAMGSSGWQNQKLYQDNIIWVKISDVPYSGS